MCTRYRATAPATASAGTAAPYEHERQVYNFASRFVRARARDSELQQTRDSGWATTRVSQNLQGFLKQQSHPAICTGIIPFFDYFDERMAGFVKRAEKFRDMAGKGFVLAQMRTSEALKYSESEESKEEGHPGWGSAPLDIPGPGGLADLKQRLVQLAEWTGDTELPDKLKETDNSFSALSVMSEFVKSDAGKDLAKEKRAILLRALSAIEAADYIGTVASHYENLHTALIGSMSDLRQAHSRTCNCGG